MGPAGHYARRAWECCRPMSNHRSVPGGTIHGERARNLDNTLSLVAGVTVLGVAFFPTGIPDDIDSPLTPLRESTRGRGRDGHSSRRSPDFWRRFHLLMSGLIVGSILFIIGTQFFDVLDDNSLLVGESPAALAFGASWLAKGLELDFLLDRTPVATPTIDPPSAL